MLILHHERGKETFSGIFFKGGYPTVAKCHPPRCLLAILRINSSYILYVKKEEIQYCTVVMLLNLRQCCEAEPFFGAFHVSLSPNSKVTALSYKKSLAQAPAKKKSQLQAEFEYRRVKMFLHQTRVGSSCCKISE